ARCRKFSTPRSRWTLLWSKSPRSAFTHTADNDFETVAATLLDRALYRDAAAAISAWLDKKRAAGNSRRRGRSVGVRPGFNGLRRGGVERPRLSGSSGAILR